MKKEKNQLEQKQLKNSFFERYKSKIIFKTSKKLGDYKDNSGSWIFFNRIIGIFLDLISWIIIAGFVWVWYTERAIPISCERISVELCNSCYTQASNIGSGIINNLSNFVGVLG